MAKTKKEKKIDVNNLDQERNLEEERAISEEFVAEKDKKKVVKKKSMLSRLLNLVLTIIIFGWVIIALIDYIKVSQEKEPMFCLEKETINYEDGNVKLCKGLGYKVYEYERASIQGTEFGPFWIKERTESMAD